MVGIRNNINHFLYIISIEINNNLKQNIMAKNKISVIPFEKQAEKIRLIIEEREEYFSEKSEKWQESEKGENYENRTTELETIIDELDSVINQIQEWNDNI